MRSVVAIVVLAAGCNSGGDTKDGTPDPSVTDPSDTDTVEDTTDTDTTPDDTTTTTDTATDTTTDTGDTTTPTVPTTDSPFALCTAVVTDTFGTTKTYYYDAGGRVLRWEFDLASDGTYDDAGDYAYVLDGEVILEVTLSTESGAGGSTVWNDAYGHAEYSEIAFGPNIVHQYWSNTLDSGNLLVQSVMTTDYTPGVLTTDYDTCEWWIHEENDFAGDGSFVDTSDAVWTDQGGCVPGLVEITVNGSPSLVNEYDSEGKLLSETGNSFSSTWTWTCP